ncbi:MAG: methyltransferase domain-containing protein [Rhodospirillaceae bacterium]|nr:methyltransferase domain-containing protein [Rhodospirillaceae bacterium]MDD9996444.1 methyltransferase domain-containing protein [Rhodospirillaceae bacterium]MDE0359867.1 methyltransferase domain-containing protein [Rhodospirillaceae bacterium]
MDTLYDTIGCGYANIRKPDPRIAKAILCALGNSESVVNVGAGTGSYEPLDRYVVAVEPSITMIAQRPAASAAVVQASAVSLPFMNDSFDASLAILTVHHWPDQARGLRELLRVSRHRVIVVTWDPTSPGFWLTDYFPEILDIDRPLFPAISDFEHALGPVTVETIQIPHDCSDGFLGAYWRRPATYLDARVRGAISTFSKLPDVSSGLNRLDADIGSGKWQYKYSDLLTEAELDIGYRLIVARI